MKTNQGLFIAVKLLDIFQTLSNFEFSCRHINKPLKKLSQWFIRFAKIYLHGIDEIIDGT